MYAVKEFFYSLQGEGANAGRPAVFIRLAGCNLWSGREVDRSGAICRFCDTDFVGADAGKIAAAEVASRAASLWPGGLPGPRRGFAILTGGEPALQLRPDLIAALHGAGFDLAIETNGTVELPPGLDWITVSPKAGTRLVVTGGQELKLVFPQVGAPPSTYEALPFNHHYLQPMDGPLRDSHTESALRFCLANPRWRLSLQTHKFLGIR